MFVICYLIIDKLLHNTIKESPVSQAEVTIRVDDGSMHCGCGQATVPEVVQGSAGENLEIIDNFD